jgi:hypothetical protein
MKIDRDTLELTRAELKALLAFASTDETRPHLCGVAIALGACPPRAYASDGHRLIVGACTGDRVGGTVNAPTMIARPELENACKLARPSDRVRIALGPPAETESVRALAAPVGIASIQVIDAKGLAVAGFWQGLQPDVTPPPVEHLIPDPTSYPDTRAGWTTLNASYLAALALMRDAAASDPPQCVPTTAIRIHTPPTELDPILFDCGAWLALIMPCVTEGAKPNPVRVAQAETPAAPQVAPEAPAPALPKGRKRKRNRKNAA